jgi:hypothetical protein
VINAVVKVDKISKNVKHVKVMDKLYKLFKWDQVCTNKYKNHVINVLVKVKLYSKLIDVKHVKVKKLSKNKKLSKLPSKKVSLKTILLKSMAKVIKYHKLYPVI